ncbi:MAG TPA: outer membrane lipoprotein carrier protein LolA, partial [Candidatus Limnocylindrales bacterium]|nr:outer membrane lipoprotein carrier protein LolA [Candidatus Limnocylindrales bacterium]
ASGRRSAPLHSDTLASMIPLLAAMIGLLSPANAKTAKDVARAIEAHYRNTKTMTAIFLEKYTSGEAGIRVESGKVYFSRPGRMRWDYDSPEKKMFLVDGRNVWYYVPADHTASRTSIKKSSDWRTPLALLAGTMNLERLCGSLQLAGAAKPSANAAARSSSSRDPEKRPTVPDNTVLVCKPRREDRDAFREALFEANPRHQLVRVTIREPGDIETEFRFGDWRENMPIAETEFHFEPPMGVAIVNDASLAKTVQ